MKKILTTTFIVGLLQLLMFPLQLQADPQNGVEGESIVIVLPTDGANITHQVNPHQTISLPIEWSEVTLFEEYPDLIISLNDVKNSQMTLADYMLIEPANVTIVDSLGVTIEQDKIEKLIHMDGLEALTQPTAAMGSPTAGLPVFGWLLDRFGISSPEMMSSAIAETSELDSSLKPTLLERIQRQLVVIRSYQILQSAKSYYSNLDTLSQMIAERIEGGFAGSTDKPIINSWVLDAKIEVTRATSLLTMATDNHEDLFSVRPQTTGQYPEDWQNKIPSHLPAFLSIITDDNKAIARRIWRQMEMERNILLQHELRIQELKNLRASYSDQFALGQRSLEAFVGISRHHFDVERQMLDTRHKYFLAQAEILALINQLSEKDFLKLIEE